MKPLFFQKLFYLPVSVTYMVACMYKLDTVSKDFSVLLKLTQPVSILMWACAVAQQIVAPWKSKGVNFSSHFFQVSGIRADK